MNKCIKDLLTNKDKVKSFAKKLPIAFERADNEMPSNPAVGLLREHIIIGYFISELGENLVQVPKGNEKGFDATICGQELSIKTLKGPSLGGLKLVWTSDQEKAEKERDNYYPDIDIFFVFINWNENKESVFYIPVDVQVEIFKKMGKDSYHKSVRGTNNRGIEIKPLALKELLVHKNTSKCNVNWIRQGINYTPYERWEKFWKS